MLDRRKSNGDLDYWAISSSGSLFLDGSLAVTNRLEIPDVHESILVGSCDLSPIRVESRSENRLVMAQNLVNEFRRADFPYDQCAISRPTDNKLSHRQHIAVGILEPRDPRPTGRSPDSETTADDPSICAPGPGLLHEYGR